MRGPIFEGHAHIKKKYPTCSPIGEEKEMEHFMKIRTIDAKPVHAGSKIKYSQSEL